jgi:hypothetical protein
MHRIERRIKRLRERCDTIQNKILPRLEKTQSTAFWPGSLSYYRSQLSAIDWALRYIDWLESENRRLAAAREGEVTTVSDPAEWDPSL